MAYRNEHTNMPMAINDGGAIWLATLMALTLILITEPLSKNNLSTNLTMAY